MPVWILVPLVMILGTLFAAALCRGGKGPNL